MTLRCARCHSDATEGELVACLGCATRLHADCRAESTGCPTLGCAHAGRRTMARPWEAPPSPTSSRTCVLWMLGAFAALIIAWVIDGVTHVAKVELWNDSGRVLRNVRLDGYQYEARPELRYAEVAELSPGASLVLRGGWSGYELQLRQVTIDGVAALTTHVVMVHIMSLSTSPGQHSTFAIDQDLRLRTIAMALPIPTPCLCPDGNVSWAGSTGCQILGHRAPRAQ